MQEWSEHRGFFQHQELFAFFGYGIAVRQAIRVALAFVGFGDGDGGGALVLPIRMIRLKLFKRLVSLENICWRHRLVLAEY